jgi:hypothetical protein
MRKPHAVGELEQLPAPADCARCGTRRSPSRAWISSCRSSARPMHGRAQRAQVVVHAHAFELAMFAVQEKPLLRIEHRRAHAEGLRIDVEHLAARAHPSRRAGYRFGASVSQGARAADPPPGSPDPSRRAPKRPAPQPRRSGRPVPRPPAPTRKPRRKPRRNPARRAVFKRHLCRHAPRRARWFRRAPRSPLRT